MYCVHSCRVVLEAGTAVIVAEMYWCIGYWYNCTGVQVYSVDGIVHSYKCTVESNVMVNRSHRRHSYTFVLVYTVQGIWSYNCSVDIMVYSIYWSPVDKWLF